MLRSPTSERPLIALGSRPPAHLLHQPRCAFSRPCLQPETEQALHRARAPSRQTVAAYQSSSVVGGREQEPPKPLPADLGQRDALESFVEWLIANGVTGIGGDDGNVAIYEERDGMRGIVCLKDLAAGEELFRVPLRLAISRLWPEKYEEDSMRLPWARNVHDHTRLAANVLREKALGEESPWHPYFQVWPTEVPSLYGSFPTEFLPELEGALPPAHREKALHRVSEEYGKLPQQAWRGITEADFRWAFSVIQSRTCGLSDKDSNFRGEGYSWLVPLFDMLNHAGRETSFLLGDASELEKNVGWELVRSRPDESAKADRWEWAVSVTATQDIVAGDAACTSYAADQPGSHFLLYYGFVPNRNPFEEVVLFGGDHEGLTACESKEWEVNGSSMAQEQWQARQQAATAAFAKTRNDLREAKLTESYMSLFKGQPSKRSYDPDKANLITLTAGGIVDERLWPALVGLCGGREEEQPREAAEQGARRLIFERCIELRDAHRSHLLEDLQVLAERLPEEDNGFFPALHQHYSQKLAELVDAGLLEEKWEAGWHHWQSPPAGAALQGLKLLASQKQVLWDVIIAELDGRKAAGDTKRM